MAAPGGAGDAFTPLCADGALDGVSAVLQSLIQRPEQLLDSESPEACGVAAGARRFAKLFFDAVAARSPPPPGAAMNSLGSLVVDGFDADQIWEELEVQNVPLRRLLRRRIKKLTEALEGAIALSEPALVELAPAAAAAAPAPTEEFAPPKPRRRRGASPVATPERPSGSSRRKKKGGGGAAAPGAEEEQDDPPKLPKPGSGEMDDTFFSEDAMHKFADEAERGMRFDEDLDDDDFGHLEVEEVDDEEATNPKDLKFDDFFAAPGARRAKGAAKGGDDEEAEEEAAEDGRHNFMQGSKTGAGLLLKRKAHKAAHLVSVKLNKGFADR